MSGRRGEAAYMEEVDDDDHIKEGTRVAASVAASPIKERANSKKTRRSGSISPAGYGHTDSDETILSPRRNRDPRSKMSQKDRERLEREREREREKAHQRNPSKKNVAIRPAPKTSKTSPVVHTYPKKTPESEYYGVQGSSAGQRFRSHTATNYGGGVPITGGSGARSMSYHGPKSHPPPANAGFYAAQQFSTSPFAPSLPGYPPSQQVYGSSYGSSYGGHPAGIAASHSPLPPPSPVDNYMEAHHHEHLKQRFQQSRPASAIGIRQTRRPSYYDDHEDEESLPRIGRKPSVKAGGKDRDSQDRAAMPPPPRPKSTRPIVLRPPPPQTHKTRGYDDESFAGESLMYRDMGRDIPPRDIPRDIPRDMARRSSDFSTSQPRTRRMSMIPGDSSLQLQGPREVRSRPNSIYGGVDVDDLDYEYGYSDKVHEQLMKAGAYQDSVAGGLTQALTKDALQKVTKRSQGGSSRSTRSSSSHDESEWRHSATTRTTRSIVGDEDVTIKVKGHAVVEVSGTKIECQDGSAISISSRPSQPQGRLIDSDKGSTVYDDRKSRVERLPHRSRAISQSGYARNHPVYEAYNSDYDRIW
ncbi:hypothetical protein jhhlp_001818 [Lomentospora prolificans]|uniref:Uncharacterized protein n=1 Tax=Lomentospora prolificans TaxID=41688 RepID=A0A2N3NGY3_9PEZI|nr:hypothetical protein jhhlp_001818 [Lomentospora prolificans]